MEIIKVMSKHQKLWSINKLCAELQRNFRTVSRALADVPADGVLNGRPGWLMSSAIAAMRRYEGRSNRFDGRPPADDDGTPAAIDRAASAVQDLLDRLRAETSVEARRALLRAEGRRVGELHRLLESDLEERGPEYPKIYGPYFSEMFAHVTAEAMELCELRYVPEGGGRP
jgi:DNA-binding transcriptional MocR family regulator